MRRGDQSFNQFNYMINYFLEWKHKRLNFVHSQHKFSFLSKMKCTIFLYLIIFIPILRVETKFENIIWLVGCLFSWLLLCFKPTT
jgi:uncharacterized membrane protein